MAFAANLLMVVLELLGLYQVRSMLSWKLVVFYTQLSNLIAFGTSVLFLFLPAGELVLLRGALTLGDNLNQRKAIRGLYFFVKFSAIMCCMCCNFVV